MRMLLKVEISMVSSLDPRGLDGRFAPFFVELLLE